MTNILTKVNGYRNLILTVSLAFALLGWVVTASRSYGEVAFDIRANRQAIAEMKLVVEKNRERDIEMMRLLSEIRGWQQAQSVRQKNESK